MEGKIEESSFFDPELKKSGLVEVALEFCARVFVAFFIIRYVISRHESHEVSVFHEE